MMDLEQLGHGIDILKKHSWIYDFQQTNFFVDQVWMAMPELWRNFLSNISYEELNILPIQKDCLKDNSPSDLRDFLKQVHGLIPSRSNMLELPCPEIGDELKRGMNPKKYHEVVCMSAIVHQMAAQSGCQIVVDVGSGLGYLGHVLHKCYNYKVIGLESKGGHTNAAEKRLDKKASTLGIKNVTFELCDSEASMEQFTSLIQQCCEGFKEEYDERKINRGNSKNSCTLEKIVQTSDGSYEQSYSRTPECGVHQCDIPNVSSKTSATVNSINEAFDPLSQDSVTNDMDNSEAERILMVGLHCCGDLTPIMMKYFTALDFIKGLCCVSCCFHRMKFTDDLNTKCINFPLSCTVKKLCQEMDWFPSLYALRLAAQETSCRWEAQSLADHEYHMKNVAYRGILQLYLSKENIEYSKRFRKIAKKRHYQSFEHYIDAACQRVEIEDDKAERTSQNDKVKERLRELYMEQEQYFKYIEPFTALQVVLQPLIEWLIYRDRELWLQEQGTNAVIKPIFDDFISPRNLAIVANKNK